MAIKSVFWNGGEGYDIHLLPKDKSRPLIDLLTIEDDTGYHSANPHDPNFPRPSGITVKFVGEFDGAPGPAHGVKLVDSTTGEVIAADSYPTTRLHNFLVRAEVSDASGTFPITPRIRVHLHGGLAGSKAWLTPNPLTIRRGADGQRFTILAEFDDGTIGDISRLPFVRWKSSDSTKIGIDADPAHVQTFQLALTANVDNAAGVSITATLPSLWGGLDVSAQCKSRPGWDTARAATIVPGGAGPKVRKDVPNFLFLPDGFDKDESDPFRQMVLKVVGFLRKDGRTSPYDHLKKALNYWFAWIESPERGCSVLHEVLPVQLGTKLVGKELPLARQPAPPPSPPATPPAWRVAEMFHEVGLPVKSDVIDPALLQEVASGDIGSTAALTAMFVLKSGMWRTLYGPKTDGRIDLSGFLSWCSFGDRRLLNERDTALGIAVGSRPNLEGLPNRYASWHPLRTTRPHVDKMLGKLTEKTGGPVIDKTWGTDGKDRRFVYVLLGGTRSSGSQDSSEGGELVASALTLNSDVPLQAAGGRAMAINPDPLPFEPTPNVAYTVAHESGHALGLGDEYAELFGKVPSDQVASISSFLNLQDEASLTGSTPGLKGNQLRWTWPRISKAGVLAAAPSAAGSDFVLPLKKGHEKPFKEGDLVQVRVRTLVGGPLAASSVLKIKSGGVAAGKLTVEKVGVVLISPTVFSAGSLVIVSPREKPAAGQLFGKQLMLVADKIRDHITQTKQPLNAPANPAPARPCNTQKADGNYQPGTNLPPGLKMKPGQAKGWIVGAFEGGMRYPCGVYHPTGACMMRNNAGDPSSQTIMMDFTGPTPVSDVIYTKAYTFCPVCRYFLVDRLDPTQHGEVDKWLSRRYPG